MENFLVLLVSGAVSGAIYALVAAGLTLTYSATGVFNFSYGGIAFSSAYVYYLLNTSLGWPIVPAAMVTVLVFAPLLGLVLNAAVFRPLAGASEYAKIVATVGLLIALPAATRWICDRLIDTFGVDAADSATVLQAGFPPGIVPVPITVWHLPVGIAVNSNQVAVLVCAALAAVALWSLMQRTTIGLRMRAVVDRRDLARIRGIDDARTSQIAWLVGSVLAALAGVAGAPILGSIGTGPFVSVVFVAAAASVLGGMRSIPLAFAGGIALGVARNLVAGYADFASAISGFAESVPTVILLVALVVLGRERGRRAGSASEEAPPQDHLAGLPQWRRALPWAAATAFLLVFILRWSNVFWAGTIAKGLALSLIFLSFVVVTGMGGMVSLAQATFVTCAALTSGLLHEHYGWPFFPAAGVAILVTVVLGLIVALPALRLGGLSLALATMALAILGDNVLFQWDWVRNSTTGWRIPRPPVGVVDLADNRRMAVFLLVVVLLVMLLVDNLRRSPWGRSIAAVRSSEVAASTAGISPLRVKLVLFALSAAIAGAGGILYASVLGNVSSTTTPASVGLLWLATAVLFGVRRPAAAAWAGVAAAATPVILQSGFHWWSWVPSWLSWDGTSSPEIPLILFGLGAVTVARDPDGFLAANAATLAARRSRRAAARAAGAPGAQVADVPDPSGVGARAAADGPGATRVGVASGPVLPGPEGAEPDRGLVLHHVEAGYGDVKVLHGVDLTVTRGRITALFGANGSGKSTLCATIAGLVRPIAGTLTLDGEDITHLAPHRRAQRGILVVPESRGVFPGLSVEENLLLCLGADRREVVYDRFPQLAARRRLPAGDLSGGEQQMLSLAPVLADPPRVVVSDEPTLGLAPMVVGSLLELLQEVGEQGTAVLLVEEKARDVLHIADDVAFVDLGRVGWTGPAAEVDQRDLVDAYLGAGRSSAP